MTFKDLVKEHFTSNGMFDSQAEEAFEIMLEDKANESMEGRWDEDCSDYPPQMKAVCLLVANRAAIQLIDEKYPLAWFRPMFEPNPPWRDNL